MEGDDPEEVELAAAGLRDAWQLGSQPIESVTASIEDAGGIVVEIHDDSVLFDGLSGWGADGTPIIVANASVPDDRRRFSLAHELGHLYMDLSDAAPNLEERLAHRFAAAFLVPASRVKQELGETRRRLDLRELAALKLKYGLSMQAWIFRAADVGVIQHAHARTLFSAFGAKGWKKVEPVTFTGREHATRLMQLAVRAVAEGLLTTDQAERICPGSSADMEEGYLQLVPELGLVNLAADERARLLERAAALMKDDYAADGALTGFDALEKEGGLGDD